MIRQRPCISVSVYKDKVQVLDKVTKMKTKLFLAGFLTVFCMCGPCKFCEGFDRKEIDLFKFLNDHNGKLKLYKTQLKHEMLCGIAEFRNITDALGQFSLSQLKTKGFDSFLISKSGHNTWTQLNLQSVSYELLRLGVFDFGDKPDNCFLCIYFYPVMFSYSSKDIDCYVCSDADASKKSVTDVISAASKRSTYNVNGMSTC